jgi:Amt family ammonium transporter
LNTLISGAVSSLLTCFLKPKLMGNDSKVSPFNPTNPCNGLLVGLVSITASCNRVEIYSAFCIGIIASFVYIFGCRLFVKLKIDDPVDASQIHLLGGFWGVIAVGIFDKEEGLIYTGNFR